jgi:hypothetical protein
MNGYAGERARDACISPAFVQVSGQVDEPRRTAQIGRSRSRRSPAYRVALTTASVV